MAKYSLTHDEIAHLMKALYMNQETLAREVSRQAGKNVSQSSISNWVNGRTTPRVECMRVLVQLWNDTGCSHPI